MGRLVGTIVEIRYAFTGVQVIAESQRDQIPPYFVVECDAEKFRAMAAAESPLIGREIVYDRDGVGEQTIFFLSRRPCEMCAGELPEGEDETCSERCAAYLRARRGEPVHRI